MHALPSTPTIRPALLRLAKLRNRVSPQELWKALTLDERRQAVMAALEHRAFPGRAAVLRKAAQILKARPQTVATLPRKEVARAAAEAQGYDATVIVSLIVHLHLDVEERRAMVVTFLDALQIPHQRGVVARAFMEALPPFAPEALAKAADALLTRFDPNQVVTFLLYWRSNYPDQLQELSNWLASVDTRCAEVEVRHSGDAGESAELTVRPRQVPNAEAPALLQTCAMLRAEAGALAEHIRTAADRVAAGGVLAGSPWEVKLASFTERLVAFRTTVAAFAAKHGSAVRLPDQRSEGMANDVADLGTFDGLTRAIERAAAAAAAASAGALLRDAREILVQALSIRHRTNPDFSPLVAYHDQVRTTLQQFEHAGEAPETHTTAAQIVERSHPIAALHRLVTQGATMDEADAQRLWDLVSAVFGTPLAIAYPRLSVAPDVAVPAELLEPANRPSALALAEKPASTAITLAAPSPTLGPTEAPSEHLLKREAAGQLAQDQVWSGVKVTADEAVGDEEVDPSSFPVDHTEEEQAADTHGSDVAGHSEPSTDEASPPTDKPPILPESVEPSPPTTADPTTTANASLLVQTPRRGALSTAQTIHEDPRSLVAEARLAGAAGARAKAALAWHLLAGDEPAFAAHLAAIAESDAGVVTDACCGLVPWAVPAWLARAATIAPAIVESSGVLAQAYHAIFDDVLVEEQFRGAPDVAEARRLLLCAATLCPAVLAPTMETGAMLEPLRFLSDLPELRAFVLAIAEFTSIGLHLSQEVLTHISGQTEWEAQLRQLQHDTQAWFAAAGNYSSSFQGATAVWRKWLERGGRVEQLLRAVLNDAEQAVPQVREEVSRLSDVHNVDRLIDQTDRVVLGRRRGDAIQAKALTKLRSGLSEALSFAQRWLDLREVDPRRGGGQRFAPVSALRQRMAEQAPMALRELDAALAASPSPRMRAGLVRVRAAVADVLTLFTVPNGLHRPDPSLERLLNAPLLRLPGVQLDEEWRLTPTAVPTLAKALVESVEQPVLSWMSAIDERIGHSDFVSADLALQVLEQDATGAHDPEVVDGLRGQFNTALDRAREQCIGEVDRLQLETGRALAQGVLNDQDRLVLSARLESVQRNVLQTIDMNRLGAVLRDVSDTLADHNALRVDKLRERMATERIGSDHPDYADIVELLQKKDLLAAEAYIEMAARGERPPEPPPEETTGFLQRFLAWAGEVDAETVVAPTQIAQTIVERGALLGLDFGALTPEQATTAAGVLRAWFACRQTRNQPDDRMLRQVLDFVGFSVNSASSQLFGNWHWSSVTTAPLRSPLECPIPYFGSQANGQYRVLWVWGAPLVKEILQEVAERSKFSGGPIIVLYLGRLSEAQRRDIRSLCRSLQVRCVALDENLLLYLAAQPGERLKAIFACALPFTVLQPYHTTAGEVPPELFVGRQHELNSLMDPNGASFVYGGRQLGKTALLRDVERRFNNPREHHVAVYVDLRTSGVGGDRPAEAVWDVLAQELRRVHVLDQNTATGKRVTADVVTAGIRAWLDKDSRRRLLALLDEADAFFEKDGQPPAGGSAVTSFPVSARLKGLMDDTKRRFKVVFAGLHNVQRMTRLANHPLVHLGEPICIGPLIANGEWRAAAALVTRPLAAMGYELAPELVIRILMQTNYYPSLIQRYCTELVKHVIDRGSGRYGSRSSPPYMITDQQVQEAYRSQELRARIRDSFTLTLDLDPRYRVIALALAYHVFTTSTGSGTDEEITVAELRERALYWWPEGFSQDNSIDMFRALLDEMVGLGILRHVGNAHYAFRSANVQLLMGTEREVEAALASPRPPEVYQPLAPVVFRRPGPRGGTDPVRSPLTAQQEADLRAPRDGINLVVGTLAAGLGDVVSFLQQPRDQSPTDVLPTSATLEELGPALEVAPRHGGISAKLVVVGPDVPWSERWIYTALERAQTRRGRVHFTQAAFVTTPGLLWELLREHRGLANDLRKLSISIVTLQPWHEAAVRQWVEDLHRAAEGEFIELLREATGFWPRLLYPYAEAIRADKPSVLRQKLKQAAQSPHVDEATRAAFGLDLPVPGAVLRILADYGPLTPEDWADMVGAEDETLLADVPDVRQWADLLGLASVNPKGEVAVHPIVRRLLLADAVA